MTLSVYYDETGNKWLELGIILYSVSQKSKIWMKLCCHFRTMNGDTFQNLYSIKKIWVPNTVNYSEIFDNWH